MRTHRRDSACVYPSI